MLDIAALNTLPTDTARAELLKCCGAPAWADEMLAQRPFATAEAVHATAAAVWARLPRAEWLAAFAAHPRIGDLSSLRQKFASTANWSAVEQAGVVSADDAVLTALAVGNQQYLERFGYIFIVCATGKSAEEMFDQLQARLPNDPDAELACAAAEQVKIMQLRLAKLLTHQAP